MQRCLAILLLLLIGCGGGGGTAPGGTPSQGPGLGSGSITLRVDLAGGVARVEDLLLATTGVGRVTIDVLDPQTRQAVVGQTVVTPDQSGPVRIGGIPPGLRLVQVLAFDSGVSPIGTFETTVNILAGQTTLVTASFDGSPSPSPTPTMTPTPPAPSGRRVIV
ncbi:MAG: hypothetical protein KC910_15620, partial [Candidatus Eremiobacteraeota bacterium]|nr:hypothetical protein [Candidatus Eremiobacteraeota bacterium]